MTNRSEGIVNLALLPITRQYLLQEKLVFNVRNLLYFIFCLFYFTLSPE